MMFTDWFLHHSTDIEISSPLRITRKGYGDMFYADAERSKIPIPRHSTTEDTEQQQQQQQQKLARALKDDGDPYLI